MLHVFPIALAFLVALTQFGPTSDNSSGNPRNRRVLTTTPEGAIVAVHPGAGANE